MREPLGTNDIQTIAEVQFMLDLCGLRHCSVRGRHAEMGSATGWLLRTLLKTKEASSKTTAEGKEADLNSYYRES